MVRLEHDATCDLNLDSVQHHYEARDCQILELFRLYCPRCQAFKLITPEEANHILDNRPKGKTTIVRVETDEPEKQK